MPRRVSVFMNSPHGRRRVSVNYERRGSGEPLLLLHGIGHHWQAWEPVLDFLAEEREVFAVDLPGFGDSDPLPDGVAYDLPEVIPGLLALTGELDLDRPHVVGNSLGGLLALELGRAGGARSVTALSPAGFWNEPERRYAFGALRGMRLGARLLPPALTRRLSRTAAGRAALLGLIYAHPERRAPRAAVAETMAIRSAPGTLPTLRSGRDKLFTHPMEHVPVTVAWGRRDHLLMRRQRLRAQRVMPTARVFTLPDCGHVPMSDAPELVAAVILDASRQVPTPAEASTANRST